MKSILKQNRFWIVFSILLSTITSVFFLLEILTNQQIISIAEGKNNPSAWIVLLIFGIYFVSYVLYYAKLRTLNITAYLNKYLLNKAYFGNVIDNNTISTYQLKNYREKASTVLTRMIDYINREFFSEIYDLVYEITFIFLGTGYLALIDWRIALISVAFYALSILVTYRYSQKNDKYVTAYTASLAKFVTKASDLIKSSIHLAAYDRVEQCDGFYQVDLESYGDNNYKSKANMKIAMTLSDLFSLLREVIILGYIGFYRSESFDLATIFILIYISTMLSEPFRRFSGHIHSILSTKSIRDELDREIEPSHNQILQQPRVKTVDKIELAAVSKSFGDKKILTNLSFAFADGKKYLIKGESGSGKTTLIDLLTGVTRQDTGDILINGSRLMDETSLYGSYSIISQSSPTLNMTVKENITLFSDAPNDEKYSDVKNIVKLKLEDSRMLDDQQPTVSGGELQKILLARALYNNSNCLILDEAFSSLDHPTAQALEELILSLNQCMVINVSHYYSQNNIQAYDAILDLSEVIN